MVPARLFRKGKSLWFCDYLPFRQTCAFSLPKKPSSNFIFPRLHLHPAPTFQHRCRKKIARPSAPARPARAPARPREHELLENLNVTLGLYCLYFGHFYSTCYVSLSM